MATYDASSISSAEAFGTPGSQRTSSATPIQTSESFGPATVNRTSGASSIASLEALGGPASTRTSNASSVGSGEAFGAALISRLTSASSIASAEAFGSATGNRTGHASSIGSLEAFGTPGSSRTSHALSIASGESFSTPGSKRTSFGDPIASSNRFGPALRFRAFQTRPVYEFEKDWRNSPAKRFSYELNDRVLGFSSPRHERTQTHTVQGCDFETLLDTGKAVEHHDLFFERLLRGRLNGFWIASPLDVFDIEPDLSGTITWTIKGQGLAQTFADHPSVYLVFTKRGQPAQIGKISSVSATADNRELVTLVNATTISIDHTWSCAKLLYVRLASDQEEARFAAPNVQTRGVRVVELPTEYATIETGTQPVYLYEFFMTGLDVTVFWRLTGLNEDIVSAGQRYVTFPIEHGTLIRSTRGEQPVSVDSWYDSRNPLTQFFPLKMSRPLLLRIYETTFPDPETRSVLFEGEIEEPSLEGKLIRAKCISLIQALGRRFPRMLIQPRCNWFLYSPPCGVNKNSFKATGTIASFNGKKIVVNILTNPAGVVPQFFALGWLETGTGDKSEWRSIDANTVIDSSNKIQLTLNAALSHAVVGQSVTFFAGCDRSYNHCQTKFANFKRFGGHVISPTNPTVRAMQSETASGNKK